MVKENEHINKFTGEVLPFKTITSSIPDKGVKNVGEDKCRLEDFEPISVLVARYLQAAENAYLDEYAYTDPNLDDLAEDTPSDVFDEAGDDLIERQIALDDYMDCTPEIAESDSAGVREVPGAVSDEGSAKQMTEEQTETETESAEA